MRRTQKALLLVVDLIVFVLGVYCVAYFREHIEAERVFSALGLWFMAFVAIGLLYIFGGYDFSQSVSPRRLVGRSVLALIVGLIFVVIVNYFVAKDRSGVFGRGILIGSFIFFAFISSAYRAVIADLMGRSFRRTTWLVICSREVKKSFCADLKKNPFQGKISFLVDKLDGADSDVAGDWSQLDRVLAESWSTVIVGLDDKSPPEMTERLMLARFQSHKIRDLIQFYEEMWLKVPLYYLGSRWFMLTEGFNLLGNPIRLRLKRLLDVMVSGGMLVAATPIMALAWLAIRLESPGPAIYRQIRTGKDGQDFVIFKFRSMTVDAEKNGAQWASKNDNRITRVGNFIRKTRIDELPQLFNILGGSMSFVGPRPERPEFNVDLNEQVPFYNMRHLVQPGLTGWAQVLYPYGASVEDSIEKLQYDLYYIKKYSLWMDISIILKTVQVVLFGRGR